MWLPELVAAGLHGTTVFDIPCPLFGRRAVDDVLAPAVAVFLRAAAGRSTTPTWPAAARSATCTALPATATTVGRDTTRWSALPATSRPRRLPRLSKQFLLLDLAVEFCLPLIGWQ